MNTKTPSIVLDRQALYHLKKIFEYTKIIVNLISGLNQNDLADVFKGTNNKKKDLSLQHALIFCYKVIGMHIDHAAEVLCLDKKSMPLFWKNLHYLRNSLIHHCPAISMPSEALELLASISTKVGQIYKYISLICNQKNTQVNLGKEKYKVFIDIHELSRFLAEKAYPRKQRENISQSYYIKTVANAITSGILSLTLEQNPLDEKSISSMTQKGFYALQNLCEVIATIMNPNLEYSLLTQRTIELIRKQHPEAENWLRSLGQSRINAIHGTATIDPRSLVTHIKELTLFYKEVISKKEFQSVLGIQHSYFTKTSSSSTTTTIAPLSTVTTVNSSNIYGSSDGRGTFFQTSNLTSIGSRRIGSLITNNNVSNPSSTLQPRRRDRGGNLSQNSTVSDSSNTLQSSGRGKDSGRGR